jgi:hypothetical protein
VEEQYEVLAVNITFLGETFPRGTIITKSGWKVQADAWNEKKAETAPTIDVDATFEHLVERKIIKLVEAVEEETRVSVPCFKEEKKGRKGKR